MTAPSALVRAIEANIHLLRRPLHCGYPEGQARCDLVADDLEEALRLYAYCVWCYEPLPENAVQHCGGSYCSTECMNADSKADAAADVLAAQMWGDDE